MTQTTQTPWRYNAAGPREEVQEALAKQQFGHPAAEQAQRYLLNVLPQLGTPGARVHMEGRDAGEPSRVSIEGIDNILGGEGESRTRREGREGAHR